MIYVDIKGNLGNQMFQYACARQIQQITGQTICLNTCFLKKYKPEYIMSLQDFELGENVVIEDKKSLPWFANTYKGIIRYIKGIFPNVFFRAMSYFGVYIWLREPYRTLELDFQKKNYYLVGYWQSTKYFDKIDNLIRKEFNPKQPLKKDNQELFNIINNTESICVTIRRGDYVTNDKYRKQFFQCDEKYFLKGIRLIKEEIADSVVIVFSDDIEWVRKNIEFPGTVYYESGKDPVWEKIRLMAACKHFVISNSSFSWWVQHLSENPNKIVYAPSKWYPDGRECDIYEPNWRYIEV